MKVRVMFASTVMLGLAMLSTAQAPAPARSDPLAAPEHKSYLPLIGRKAGLCGTVPTLLAPPDGARLATLLPTFQWDCGEDMDATECELQVATETTFDDPVIWMWYYHGQGWSSYSSWENLTPGWTHYWRTRLGCGEAHGPWSEVWTFTTGSGGVVLPAPALLAPPNGTTPAPFPLTLQWEAISGAEGYRTRVRTEGFWYWQHFCRNRGMYCAGMHSNLEPGSTYEWQVSAWNDYANGHWSDIWKFTTPAVQCAEPDNNQRQGACGPIMPGLNYRYDMSDANDESDWFYLDVATEHTIEAWLSGIPVACDYDLYLRRADGSHIVSSASAGSAEEHILWGPVPAGRYYLVVVHIAGSCSGELYVLRAEFGQAWPPSAE